MTSQEEPALMEPEPKTETEPVPEPDVEPETHPEIHPDGHQPKAEGHVIVNGTRPWYLRVDPDWRHLERDVGAAWPLHTYLTGVVFTLIAIISFIHIVRLMRMPKSQGKPYYITLHCLLFVCGTTRAIHFLVDPYNLHGNLPLVLAYITMNIYDPCTLSAFILVFVALIKVTRMRLISGGLFHPLLIAGIIVVSFTIELSSDIMVSYIKGSRIYAFVCQVYFVIWGMVSSILYTYLFCRLYNRLFMTRVKINRMSQHRPYSIKRPEKIDGDKGFSVKVAFPDCVYTLDNVASADEGQGCSGEDLSLDSSEKVKECAQDVAVCDSLNTSTDFNTESVPSGECAKQRYQTNSPIRPKGETNTSLNAPLCSPPKHENGSSNRHNLLPRKSPDAVVSAKVPLVAKLVLAAAIMFLLTSCLSLLSIIMGALQVCEDAEGYPESWCWWLCQTTVRFVEMCMVGVITIIGGIPLYTKKQLTGLSKH